MLAKQAREHQPRVGTQRQQPGLALHTFPAAPDRSRPPSGSALPSAPGGGQLRPGRPRSVQPSPCPTPAGPRLSPAPCPALRSAPRRRLGRAAAPCPRAGERDPPHGLGSAHSSPPAPPTPHAAAHTNGPTARPSPVEPLRARAARAAAAQGRPQRRASWGRGRRAFEPAARRAPPMAPRRAGSKRPISALRAKARPKGRLSAPPGGQIEK